jgi:outer membrane protein OmpA-like peptidoglycan-associated protein
MRITSLFLLTIFTCLLFSGTSVLAAPPDFMLKKMGTVSGRIYINDAPKAFAVVSFFLKKDGLPPIAGGMRRVPQFISRTDGAGKFRLDLLAGEYYVGVLIRDPGDVPGPPREGERYYFASEKEGELNVLTVGEQEIVDKGRLNVASSETFLSREDFFTVEGVIRDEKGGPVKGMVVLAKSQLNIPRPEFVSIRTEENGRYQLKLPPLKAFYLVARETIAGARPRPGTLIGTYGIESKSGLATPSIFSGGSPPPGVVNDANGDKALTLSGGSGEKTSNADIFMYMVPDPEVIKTSIQGTINAPKFETGAALNKISFANNSHRLDHDSYDELDRWAVFLKGREGTVVELHGHTDRRGDAGYNRKLSASRAQAVADYLVAKGVKFNRVVVKGFGFEQPIASNDTPEGRGLNRRVEIKFFEPQQ